MNITVPNNNDTNIAERFFLHKVIQYGASIRIIVAYKSATSGTFECLLSEDIPANITASDSMTDKVYNLLPSATIPDEYASMHRIKASITIGTCVDIINNKDLTFEYDTTIISPMAVNVVIPISEEFIDSVTIRDANDKDIAVIKDDFVIKAGAGIRMYVDWTGTMPTLVIERVGDADNNKASTVEEAVDQIKTSLGTPITSINGVVPSANGNIAIVGKTCTEVTTGTSSLYISNPCATPCCPETATELGTSIVMLQNAANRLLQYFETINTTITSMQSRLAALIAYRK
jgi:hypothetical protein